MKWEAIKMTSRGCVSSRAEADTSQPCSPAASARFIHIGWTPRPSIATPRQCATANDPQRCTGTAGDFSRARKSLAELCVRSSLHQSYRRVSSALKCNILYSRHTLRVALTNMLGKVIRRSHAQTQQSIQTWRWWHLDALLLWLIIQSKAINLYPRLHLSLPLPWECRSLLTKNVSISH